MMPDHRSFQRNWQIFLALVFIIYQVGWNYGNAGAAATTYYVDNTNGACSDTGTGTAPSVPFCTISKAAGIAVAGDTVQVLAGTYAETVNGARSGSAGLPITYSAAPGVVVTGNGLASGGNAFRMSGKSYIVVDGFTITGTADYGIFVSGSNNITITNNHVSYSGQPASGSTRAGIYINSTTSSTINGNTSDHNSSHGILLTSNANNNLVSNNSTFANAEGWQRNANGINLTGSTNNTILHNIAYANEDSGMMNNTGSTGNSYIGNLIYGNGDHGIDNFNAPGNIIIGNTVHGNVTTGINFEGTAAPGSSGATVMNNIMVDNGLRLQVGGGAASGQPGNLRFDTISAPVSGSALDYNLYYLNSGTVQIVWGTTNYGTLAAFQTAVSGYETHGLQANPLFSAPAPIAQRPSAAPFNVSVNVGDYHIQAGSPAIDSAYADAPSEPLLDLDGNARVDDPFTADSGAGTRTYDDRGAYEFQAPVGATLPAVTTQAVTEITVSTATGNGNLTDLGVPNATQYGVVWSTAANPTVALATKTTQGVPAGTGAFTSSITGLTATTLYHVRAYATNSSGTAYGADVTFTTPHATYYVDNTNSACSDTGTGTTPSVPFCTIGKAAGLAVAGDTVQVLAGTYAETVNGKNSGSAGLPITYSAAPGVTVTGNGSATVGGAFRMTGKSYIVVDGFTVTGTVDYGIYMFGSNNITITNNHISYSGQPASGSIRAGIYINSTTNSTISGNTSDHNSSHGILLTNGANNNLVSNNLAFANAQQFARDASGIRLDGSNNNTILHNVTYGNEDSGVTSYTGSSGNSYIGNLTYGNGDHGFDFNAAPNNTVIGNTVQGNVTTGINFEGTTAPASGGATVMNNIMVDNGWLQQVGGGVSGGAPGNLRFDSMSLVGDTFDYNLFYLTGSGIQIQWNGTNYSTLAAFQAAVPGQETHGLQANPFLIAPAPIAQRPASAPYNVVVNVGDYHLTSGSPAIDSAYADAPSEPASDVEGNTRVDDPFTVDSGAGARTYDDRGAYEFQPPAGATLPTVTTQAVTNIATATATGNGTVSVLGTPNPTQHGVVWSKAVNPTIQDNKTADGPVSDTGAFTSSITGLAPATLYHVRAYAWNAAGVAYGEDVTLTTPHATYYVDTTNGACSDTGTGTTTAAPFCTIGKAASLATAGDTVRVLAGTYAETVNAINSGSVGLPITYSAAPGVTVNGNGSAVTGGAFRITSKNYIVIDGFTITGTSDYGIYVFGSNNITITNNHVSYSGQPVSGSSRAGIYINSSTSSTISGNTSDHNSSHGILLTNGANNNLVSNNITFANAQQFTRDASGIRLDSSNNNTILHNTSYSNEDSGVTNYNGSSGNFEIGNLLYGNGDHGIDDLNSPNNIMIGNTVQGNVTTGINFEGTASPGSGGATVMNNILVDNGLLQQVGGGTSGGQPGNLRFDAMSLAGNIFDYNVFYVTGSGTQIQWNGTNYPTLAAFQLAVPGQETHGLQANPFFIAPAPIAQRPAGAPFNVAVNVGDYHLMSGSPAIDSAYADAPSQPSVDLEGNARVDDPFTMDSGLGTRTYDDRGAYEFQPVAGALLPTVTTQTVTNVAQSSATGNGTVSVLGTPNPTQHGFVWGMAANPTVQDNKTADGPISATGGFTSDITGLIAGTVYHTRAYAWNAAGISYGDDVIFTTPHATYYVDKTNPSCNDAGLGATAALPFCTIGKAAGLAAAGDTVQVLAGTYAETVNGARSGSAGLPITYSAAPGVVVTGNGLASGGNAFRMLGKSYIVVNGFTITGTADYGIYVFGSNNITITNNHVSYSGQPVSGSTRAGIYLNSTTNSTLSGNTSDHNSSHGIYLTGGSNNNLVSNNFSFGNAQQFVRDASGIRLDGNGTTNNTILHNVSYGNEDSGITNYSGASGNFEIGNLLYGNGDHGIDDYNSPNNVIIGNTVHGNVTTGINFEGTASPGSGGATVMNNLLMDNGLRMQVGGGTSAGQPGNLRFDAMSLVGDTFDYNIFYLSSSGTQIQWNGTNYSTLAAFQLAVPGQETYGLEANPLFLAAAPIAQRPASAPYNVAVNVGDYHVKAASPAIDSGNSSAPNEPTLDLDGNARVDDPGTANTGAGVRTYDDRGVYEFQPLVVTTQAVTSITQTSATGNGNITSFGTSSPTQHGVVWGTKRNPTTADSKTTDGPVSVTGAFTSNITGLTPGTLYHVRAYATNSAGTSYGSDVSFTTLPASVAPTVTTQAVTNITQTSATGNGNITSLGVPNPTQYGVVWDIAVNPTVALTTKTAQGVPAGTGAFTSSITGLTPGTLYHVRAYATNSAGTSYGSDITFTTLAVPVAPTVTTQAVTNITQTSATGNGNITALGVPDPTQYGVVWDTAVNPTVALSTKTTQGVPAGTGAFTSNITGLIAGTLYHVRAYATNSAGTAYGADVSFTTLAAVAPSVTTLAVTGITQTTATGNGNITSLGVPNSTQYGVVWDTAANPTTALSTKTAQGAPANTGAFTSNITGLTPGTLYHVRAYATNSAGTVYGADVTFSTVTSTAFFFANMTVASSGVITPNNGWLSDNQYATFSASTNTADYGFANLGIPSNATIVGIEVVIEGNKNKPNAPNLTAALWNTSALNPDAFTATKTASLGNKDTNQTLGGPTDTWGTTWTPADFAAGIFKIRVGVTSGTGTDALDAVSIRVYYIP